MRSNAIKWTEEKVAQLHHLINLELSDEDIATRIGVSKKAMQSKRGKLGISNNIHLTKEYRIAWTPSQIAKLRKLVNEGISNDDIANILGVTKNAIVGKKYRLNISDPNVISHIVISQVKSPVKSVENTQVTLSGSETPAGKHSPPDGRFHPEHPESFLAILPGPRGTCKFPFGGIKTGDLTWCGDPVQLKSSYCPEHHKRCHVSTSRNVIKSAGITRWR